MKNLHFMWDILKGKRLKLVITFFIVAFYVLLSLMSPLIFSFFIDNVINLDPIHNSYIAYFADLLGGVEYIRNHLWLGAIVVIVLNVVICILIYLRGKFSAQVSEFTTEKLRNKLYYHLSLMPYGYHVRSKSGDLIQRCTSDVEQIRKVLAGQLTELVYAILTAIIAITILFNIYTPLAWIAVVSMPFIAVFAFIFFVNVQKTFKQADEAEGRMSEVLQENLSATRVVKAFNQEKEEIHKFQQKNMEYTKDSFKLIKLLGIYWGASDFFCLAQILLVLIVGIFYARDGAISVGDFFVFVSYESMILFPLRNVGRILADIGKVSVSIDRLNFILEEEIEDVISGKTPEIKGNIEFKHVYFKYDDGNKDVLKDISFSVSQGETVAILGPTGSGKSSLVHLLTRLYDYKGSILVDNVELNEIQKAYLRNHVGIVLQEPFLFSKSIYENIRLSNPKAGQSEVYDAAKVASIHSVITDFEMGYNTLVGEKGVTLSGGQKQRIAIARTIVNESPILIFDDSLSALDTQTDANIRAALSSLSKDTTTFLITHRVSSAQSADKIIVLDHGRIIQTGDHNSLISEEGLYKRIYEIQNSIKEEA